MAKFTKEALGKLSEIIVDLGHERTYGSGDCQADLAVELASKRAANRGIDLDKPQLGLIHELFEQLGNWSAIAQQLEKHGVLPERAKGARGNAVADLLD